jgi:hypothetical protein
VAKLLLLVAHALRGPMDLNDAAQGQSARGDDDLSRTSVIVSTPGRPLADRRSPIAGSLPHAGPLCVSAIVPTA